MFSGSSDRSCWSSACLPALTDDLFVPLCLLTTSLFFLFFSPQTWSTPSCPLCHCPTRSLVCAAVAITLATTVVPGAHHTHAYTVHIHLRTTVPPRVSDSSMTMRYAHILAATALLAEPALGATWSAPMRRWEAALSKRVSCGEGAGECPADECCSEAGYCGKETDYCKSPQCQIEYSNGNCDAE